jgi:hypothetical protein
VETLITKDGLDHQTIKIDLVDLFENIERIERSDCYDSPQTFGLSGSRRIHVFGSDFSG